TKSYSLQEFGKNIGTRCPVEQIEYVDENGVPKVIDCCFKGGENKGKSKGLVELCKDLGVQLLAQIELDEIRDMLSRHRAFQNATKLEMLGIKYKIKIIYYPSVIANYQCFDKMIKLISESRINFVE
ncbi:unnamed protein product, partial [Didymodactylos carnosus]